MIYSLSEGPVRLDFLLLNLIDQSDERSRSSREGLTFHDSRHEAITRLAAKLNVLDLARMVGHRDIKQLQTYYNATAEDIAEKL